MALPNNFAEGLMSFKQGIKDMKRIFNPTGPGLPEADAAMVADAERLYAEAAASTSDSSEETKRAHDEARFRLAWALAHSKKPGHAARAVDLLLPGAHQWCESVLPRDRRYIAAVAHFNDGDYLAARNACEESLSHDPECRQATSLLAAIEDRIAADGVIGIGALGVGAAVLTGVVATLASSRR